MSVITVYKVKDLESGLFMNKHGSWDKKGKTWESLGKLKLSLGAHGYWSNSAHYKPTRGEDTFGDQVKIITIQIVESEDNMEDLDNFVEKQRRYIALGHSYGDPFRELVERIEKQGQQDQFAWVLAADGTWDYNAKVIKGDFAELLQVVKDMKLKQNKDYKKASNFADGGCVAFASKQLAMTVRLAMRGKCKGIDIQKYVEMNLDEPDGEAV